MASIGKIRFNNRGQWVVSTAYTVDDVVTYHNHSYICVLAHTASSGNAPVVGMLKNSSGVAGTYWRILTESMDAQAGATGYQASPYGNTANYNSNSFYLNKTYSEWTSTATYYNKDVVTYKGATYILMDASNDSFTNIAPTANTSWKVLASGRAPKKYASSQFGGSNMGQDPATWPATNYSPGDTLGHPKAAACHGPWGNIAYINRRGGVIRRSAVSGAYGEAGITYTAEPSYRCYEPAFTHIDWMEGLKTPTGEPPKCIQIEQSYYTTLYLFDNGEVHAAGYGGHGQMGIGDTTSYSWPVRCGNGNFNRTGATTALRNKKAIRIAISSGYTDSAVSCYALIDNLDGTTTLYSWGYNGYGQLGLGDTTNRSVPTAVTFGGVGNIVDVWATGGSYGVVYIITDQGYMYAAGYNGYGQIGNGTTTNATSFVLVKQWGTGTTRVKKFSITGNAAVACAVVTADGKLWTWGDNTRGNLGHGHTYNVYIPLQVYTGGYTGVSAAVTSSGTAGTPSGTAITDAQNVWIGGHQTYFSMFFTRGSSQISNNLWACGYNGYANLGDGTTTQRNTAVQPYNSSTAAAMTNVVNVTLYGGHYDTPVGTYVEKYLGPHEDSWYFTEWYFQGYAGAGAGTGYGRSYNGLQGNLPNATTAVTDTAGPALYFHKNLRYSPGMNPYRLNIRGNGLYSNPTAYISATAWDRDSGEMWATGYYSNGPLPMTPKGTYMTNFQPLRYM